MEKDASKPLGLELAASFWALELLSRGEIAEIATRALVEGRDSASLRLLVGDAEASPETVERRWSQALLELAIEVPEPEQAVLEVTRYYAGCVAGGEMAAPEGAKAIWRLGLACMRFPDELLPFIRLATKHDEHTAREARGKAAKAGELARIEEEILGECRTLLAGKARAAGPQED